MVSSAGSSSESVSEKKPTNPTPDAVRVTADSAGWRLIGALSRQERDSASAAAAATPAALLTLPPEVEALLLPSGAEAGDAAAADDDDDDDDAEA
mmetsp:Transcript_44141/g.94645  ORF Transcript_44141/g.94645 Transcript_44141/m.94645 type:complete len:95 (+) Transcript_44141:245-529(+)